uniref:Uncharacterized protein n=1 Tax=Fundulus heteroclitus TaxID=8078 RepID=A0A3Q2QTQ1_FUNHE
KVPKKHLKQQANTPVLHQQRSIYGTLHLDSCTPAFTHSIRHGSSRRIDHRYEAKKAQVFSGEVHFVSVKSKALRKLVVRQVEMTET